MTSSSTVLLTGATGKIGRQLALGFAKQGALLVLPVRSPEQGLALKKLCLSAGAEDVVLIPVDLISESSALEIGLELERRSLFPEILINNARNIEYLSCDQEGFVGRESWQGEFLLNVIVPYELTMALLSVSKTRLQKVINIASMYGVTAPNLDLYVSPDQSSINYGVTKAAVIHLTKELAVRLAKKNVAVNSVSFGGVDGRVDERFQEAYARLCPSGKMLSEKDVFGPVKFLASSDSTEMTGHNLVVDGGWTIW